ncbi:carbohydrate kinase [Actinomycetaceae bacterium TAE3-ERU4]|nr:carbohydrate kinase [Actinomycetaceae bacterium TAE3-ERU4]
MGMQMEKYSALVLGEALVDIVEKDNQITRVPGGSPANVALGLARLGRSVRLGAWLSHDELGEMVSTHLRDSGVELEESSFAAPQTSTARARIGVDGSAEYEFNLEWDLSVPTLRKGDVVVHTGSIAAVISPGATKVRQVLEEARSQATISFDPNARPTLMGKAEEAAAVIAPIMQIADVVKISDEDASYFFGQDLSDEDALDAFGKQITSSGVKLLVVTAGEKGAYAYTRGGERFHRPVDRVEVADTVGAGDSFMAGILDALWQLGLLGADKREALGEISSVNLARLMNYASSIAGITVSRTGANIPNKSEVSF